MKFPQPKGWVWARCHDVIDVRDGTHDTPNKVESGIPMVTSKNLKPYGIDFDDVTYISEEDYEAIEKRSGVDDGDILFAMIGTIGNPVLVKKDRPFSIKNVALFKMDETKVHAPFFKFMLDSPVITQQLDANSRGGNQKFVSLSSLRNMQLPLPPLPEQKRIAAILDKADSIRRKRQEAVRLTEELLRSVFLDMFGDPVTNPKGWDFGTVEDALENGRLIEIQDGNHGEKHPKVADFSTAGIPFIMANCLVNGQLDTEKAYKLDGCWLKKLRIGFAKPGDLLLSHKGTVGEVAIVPETYPLVILSPQVTYYRIGTNLDTKFLAGYFSSTWFQSILKNEAEQSTRAYIGITRQRILPLMLPPIELQREFARRVVVAEKLMVSQLNALLKDDTLFNSLLHHAFKGEL